jgi:hypothetical protein
MTFPSDIDLCTAYEADAPAAQEKIHAAALDADHLELERWINAELLPALAQILREDGTLVDGLVRYRNLHPEIWDELVEGVGSLELAVPANNSVATAKLQLLAVTTAILADLSVTTGKIASLAVTTAKIAALAVDASKLAADAVTTAKILDQNVTTAKIADGAVATAKIADGAVTAVKTYFGAYLDLVRSNVSPNGTVPAHVIKAVGAEAAIDMVAAPKGAGAFQLQVADDATTGGAKRGANAVDLQMIRANADQVAAAQASAILGGARNKLDVSALYSAIIAGYECLVSSCLYSLASGQKSIAQQHYSRVHGAFQGPGYTSGLGCQSEDLILGRITSDATPVALTDGTITRSVIMSDQQAVMVVAQVVGYQRGATANAAGYVVEFIAKKGVGSGTTTIVGAATVRAIEDNAAWNVTVAAVDPGGLNSGVDILVTGAAGVVIDWTARVSVIKMRRAG